MIKHHPDDALLLTLAAGSLGAGPALLVASHLEVCDDCRERLHDLEALGGVLLEDLPMATLSAGALADTLAAIDGRPAKAQPPRPATRLPALPPGMAWPRALDGCRATGWRWIAPGTRFSRITPPNDADANVFLLRMGAGRGSAFHTHTGSELTQVLLGAFHEGRGTYALGDFDEADDNDRHMQTVDAAGECICLVSVEGRVQFDGLLPRLMGALTGM